MLNFPGRCHCANIVYQFSYPSYTGKMPVRACGCSFCVKHGAVYASHPDGRLDVVFTDPARVRRYRFGHESADFVICAKCGVLVFAVCTIDGNDYAVINVNTFATLGPEDMERVATDFEDEGPGARRARRKRNWTGTVTVTEGAEAV